MTSPLIVPLPGNEALAEALAGFLDGELGKLIVHTFPDGETYVSYDTLPSARNVILACTLHRPDSHIMPLIFSAAAARDLGAQRVGLVAPYLAYMRQDKRFNPGEAITSAHFAELLSAHVDWLVTVDPHLHRRKSLDEIYEIPAIGLHAGPEIAQWIRREVRNPVIVGPDSESEQWVSAVARAAGAPHTVLEKTRRGDRDVEVSVPHIDQWRDRQPIIMDDIVSTAHTMVETVKHLVAQGMTAPICIGIHGIFAGYAYERLLKAGAAKIVTCNTIPHPTNGIDIRDLLAGGVRRAGQHPG